MDCEQTQNMNVCRIVLRRHNDEVLALRLAATKIDLMACCKRKPLVFSVTAEQTIYILTWSVSVFVSIFKPLVFSLSSSFYNIC